MPRFGHLSLDSSFWTSFTKDVAVDEKLCTTKLDETRSLIACFHGMDGECPKGWDVKSDSPCTTKHSHVMFPSGRPSEPADKKKLIEDYFELTDLPSNPEIEKFWVPPDNPEKQRADVCCHEMSDLKLSQLLGVTCELRVRKTADKALCKEQIQFQLTKVAHDLTHGLTGVGTGLASKLATGVGPFLHSATKFFGDHFPNFQDPYFVFQFDKYKIHGSEVGDVMLPFNQKVAEPILLAKRQKELVELTGRQFKADLETAAVDVQAQADAHKEAAKAQVAQVEAQRDAVQHQVGAHKAHAEAQRDAVRERVEEHREGARADVEGRVDAHKHEVKAKVGDQAERTQAEIEGAVTAKAGEHVEKAQAEVESAAADAQARVEQEAERHKQRLIEEANEHMRKMEAQLIKSACSKENATKLIKSGERLAQGMKPPDPEQFVGVMKPFVLGESQCYMDKLYIKFQESLGDIGVMDIVKGAAGAKSEKLDDVKQMMMFKIGSNFLVEIKENGIPSNPRQLQTRLEALVKKAQSQMGIEEEAVADHSGDRDSGERTTPEKSTPTSGEPETIPVEPKKAETAKETTGDTDG